MSGDLVQLDWFEFDRRLLDGAGKPLPTQLEGRPVLLVPDPYPDPADPPVPTEGWRIVHDRTIGPWDEGGRTARQVVLAAPAGQPGMWVLLHVDGRGDHWRAQAALQREQVRPSRAVRRRHLRLAWPDGEVVAAVGDAAALVAAVRPTLTNTGDEPWRRHAQEGGPVVVHIADPATGDTLPARSQFAYAPLSHPVELPPGGSTRLDAVVLTGDVDRLPAGTYGLTGTWASLDLLAEPAHLRLD